MESLINSEKQVESKKKKDSLQGDRITLVSEVVSKIDGWLRQIEEKTSGMVKLSKSELVNYILQKKDAEIFPSELNQIRKDNYDEVKFAYWALMKIKEAKKAGETITLEDLMRVQKGLGKTAKESFSDAAKQNNTVLKNNKNDVDECREKSTIESEKPSNA